jgi:hypothetical protein
MQESAKHQQKFTKDKRPGQPAKNARLLQYPCFALLNRRGCKKKM